MSSIQSDAPPPRAPATTSSPAATRSRRIHPLMATAAIAVTALCITGIAALTGVLHSGVAGGASPPAISGATPAGEVQASQVQPSSSQVQPPTSPMASSTGTPAVASAAVPSRSAPVAAASPVAATPAQSPSVSPAPASSHHERVATAPNTGTVVSVRRIEIKPSGSGVGAVAGGVLGGVLGHQVGSGRGNDVATVLGAVGGAFAGNEVEKYQRRTYRYEVTVRTDSGATRVLHYSEPPGVQPGERIPLQSAAG